MTPRQPAHIHRHSGGGGPPPTARRIPICGSRSTKTVRVRPTGTVWVRRPGRSGCVSTRTGPDAVNGVGAVDWASPGAVNSAGSGRGRSARPCAVDRADSRCGRYGRSCPVDRPGPCAVDRADPRCVRYGGSGRSRPSWSGRGRLGRPPLRPVLSGRSARSVCSRLGRSPLWSVWRARSQSTGLVWSRSIGPAPAAVGMAGPVAVDQPGPCAGRSDRLPLRPVLSGRSARSVCSRSGRSPLWSVWRARSQSTGLVWSRSIGPVHAAVGMAGPVTRPVEVRSTRLGWAGFSVGR